MPDLNGCGRSFFAPRRIELCCMDLSFLPREILAAVNNVNLNFLTEIRLRRGQPVIIEYRGAYRYLCAGGAAETRRGAIICGDVVSILNGAMGGCVYSYAEELKQGFITVGGGIRIGVAGEYVTENGQIKTIARATSLNIRIPHRAEGCSSAVYGALLSGGIASVLLFSRPGLGKTTMLRDLTARISREHKINVLVLDARNEIGGAGEAYDLGETVDVVKSCDKLPSVKSAIRAMRPELIITDELYGESDIAAVRFARDCGIDVIASSHVCDKNYLKSLPFDYYVRLNSIGGRPDIYDKNFDIVGDSSADDVCGHAALGRKKEEGGGIRGTV